MNAIRLLGFSDFFPGIDLPSKEECALIVGKDSIQRLGCLMLTYCKTGHTPSVLHLLQMWFQTKELPYTNSPTYHAMSQSYNKLVYTSMHQNYYLLSEEALLNLYIWSTNHPLIPDQLEHTDGSFMLQLFMLYLLFNEDVLNNFQKADDTSKKDIDHNNIRRVFSERFPQNDLVNVDYGKLMFTQLVKLMQLLNFLEAARKYQDLYNHFLNDFDCANKEDFFKSLGGAILIPLNPHKTGINELEFDESGNKQKQKSFLDKLAFELGDVTIGPTDYKFLRDKPLQGLGNSYRVVFDLFLIKKLYNGIIFKLSGYVTDKPELLKGPFFGEIRNDFSEEVLVYNTFEKLFGQQNTVQCKGTDFKKAEIKREPDYYVRIDDKIMLIESKDFFMVAAEKLSYDYDVIMAGLQKDGRLGKAVLQSATNAGRVLLQSLQLDTAYNPNIVKIYPVILVHDSLYNCPGLNLIINQWFQTELNSVKAKLEYQSVNFSGVQNVVLIDIDSLILYQKNFELAEIDLFQFLDEYITYTDFLSVTDEMNKLFNRALLPFSQFISFYTQKRKVIPHLDLIQNLYKDSGYSN